MLPTAPFPDALFIPEKLKRGRTLFERMNSILAFSEPMLGVDRSRGERAYIHRQPGGWLFVATSPFDTIYHPQRTPLQGRPRYAWVEQAGGIRWGYLTEAARKEIDDQREREAKAGVP